MSETAEYGQACQLKRILCEVARRGDGNFTGTSVVVCDSVSSLSHCGLAEGWPIVAEAGLGDNLLAMAHSDSPYHDGFHLLTSAFDFLKVACYLAPQIPDGAPLVSFAGRGSRFSTAYFTSLLPSVMCVGIVGHRREVTVFRQGHVLAHPDGPLAVPTGLPSRNLVSLPS